MQTTNNGAEKCKVKDHVAILIHPLKNGLFSVKITSSLEKCVFSVLRFQAVQTVNHN